MTTTMNDDQPGESHRMISRSLIAPAAALSALSLALLCGCAASSEPGSASGSELSRAQIVARDTSELLTRMQTEESARIREALELGQQGDDAYRDDRFEDAIEFYSQAVTQYDEFFALWNNLGIALMATDRYPQAEEAFIRASSIKPSDPRPLYNRGLLYRDRGYPNDARRYFEQALDQDEAYLDALLGSIRADITISDESTRTLDRIRKALFIVTDAEERLYLELERERISSKLGLSESGRSRDRSDSQP
jgi:tetratricopeptide (TPR) repeat protein